MRLSILPHGRLRVLLTCMVATMFVTGQTLMPTSEDECPIKSCCVEDCCEADTAWDGSKCVASPGAPGWNGVYSLEFSYLDEGGCNFLACCEGDCCGDGTSFDMTLGCCVSSGDTDPCSNTTATQSNSAIRSLAFGSGAVQDQELTLTCGAVAETTETCVRGGISLAGNGPPYNIGFVIDVSGSTLSRFGGTPTGTFHHYLIGCVHFSGNARFFSRILCLQVTST